MPITLYLLPPTLKISRRKRARKLLSLILSPGFLETFQLIVSQTKQAIVICGWQYSDTKQPVDPHDDNVIVHTILKVAVTKLIKLVPA